VDKSGLAFGNTVLGLMFSTYLELQKSKRVNLKLVKFFLNVGPYQKVVYE